MEPRLAMAVTGTGDDGREYTIHGYKRPEWFLDLAERLPARRFVMVGGPSIGGEGLRPGYFEEIRRRAQGLANVEFTGFLPLAGGDRLSGRHGASPPSRPSRPVRPSAQRAISTFSRTPSASGTSTAAEK